jgi:hypothetical protein
MPVSEAWHHAVSQTVYRSTPDKLAGQAAPPHVRPIQAFARRMLDAAFDDARDWCRHRGRPYSHAVRATRWILSDSQAPVGFAWCCRVLDLSRRRCAAKVRRGPAGFIATPLGSNAQKPSWRATKCAASAAACRHELPPGLWRRHRSLTGGRRISRGCAGDAPLRSALVAWATSWRSGTGVHGYSPQFRHVAPGTSLRNWPACKASELQFSRSSPARSACIASRSAARPGCPARPSHAP